MRRVHETMRRGFVIAWLVLLAAGSWAEQAENSDREILAMGYDRWVARGRAETGGDTGLMVGVEEKFIYAMVRQNEAFMDSVPERKDLKEIQLIQANLTKGACRAGDYCTQPRLDALLINRKAETATVRALNGYLYGAMNSESLTQADVWKRFEEVRALHETHRKDLADYHQQRGGYTVDQFFIEYQSVAWNIGRLMKAIANAAPDQKRHMFRYSIQMIEITRGIDPLPYPDA